MEALVCSSHSRGSFLLVFSFIYLISGTFNGVHARFHFHKNSSRHGVEENAFPPEGSFNCSSNKCNSTFDVQSYGAVGDGVTDDTEAFELAWQAACHVESSVVLIPAGYSFLIQSITFYGPCKEGMTFQVDGVLLAPDGPDCWANNSSKLQWIVFAQTDGLSVHGNGLIDGRGEKWWNLPCKPHRGPNNTTLPGPCDSPTAVKFFKSSRLTVKNLRIRNSPQFHVRFDSCDSVVVDSIIIQSPALSPNTDGIHLSGTRSAQIYDSRISNGDDCISIVAGCSEVDIQNVICGPSHGISIGGLGQNNSKACVSNITVSNALIKNSDNGLRIKTWQGGIGSVSDVTFKNIYVENVRNPIIINQFYGFTKNESEAVHVSGITYQTIRGTYDVRSPPMTFACSDAVPCTNITLANIELLPAQGQTIDEPFCWKAFGTLQTLTVPPVTCLNEGKPESTPENMNSCSY